MSKIIFWIVIVFVVLFGLRLLNVAKAKARRRSDAERQGGKPPAEAMVRCARCGVFLPRADARPAGDGFRCGDPGCAQRR